MIETVFKGATRPPMKFGVPLAPLVVLLLAGFIAGMWLYTLVNWRFAPVIFGTLTVAYAWMRMAVASLKRDASDEIRSQCREHFVRGMEVEDLARAVVQ